MKSPLNPGAPSEVVKAFFDHLMAGRPDLALECWSPQAVWHVTGGSSWGGDYNPRDYLAMGARWYAQYPDYTYKLGRMSEVGQLAFFSIRSQGGEAPGAAEGMMIYRVVDWQIVEGWAIPASGEGHNTF